MFLYARRTVCPMHLAAIPVYSSSDMGSIAVPTLPGGASRWLYSRHDHEPYSRRVAQTRQSAPLACHCGHRTRRNSRLKVRRNSLCLCSESPALTASDGSHACIRPRNGRSHRTQALRRSPDVHLHPDQHHGPSLPVYFPAMLCRRDVMTATQAAMAAVRQANQAMLCRRDVMTATACSPLARDHTDSTT